MLKPLLLATALIAGPAVSHAATACGAIDPGQDRASARACLDTSNAYAVGGTSNGYARVQYDYGRDGARYLGPPVYRDGDNDQPFTQTPSYYYNNPTGYARPGYGYDDRIYGDGYAAYDRQDYRGWNGVTPGVGYGAYVDQGYTEEQNLRERRAFAANQQVYGRSYYASPYASSGYGAPAESSWQDEYGRRCTWRNQSDDDRYPSWIQVCR